MKGIIALLIGMGMKTLTDTATEDQVSAGIKSLIDEKDAKIKALDPMAAEGKAYRDSLISDYVAKKAKLGEVAETPEAQDAMKSVAAGYPLNFINDEIKHLDARIAEKFPNGTQLEGEDGEKQREKGAEVPADMKKRTALFAV